MVYWGTVTPPTAARAPSVNCPECGGHLAGTDPESLVCSACSSAFPLRDGIPLLGRALDYYYDEIPRQAMEWFLGRAREGDFAGPFERHDVPGPWEFILGSHFDVTRASWKVVTRLPPNGLHRVLDFGCGWGVNALALAPHAEEVVAVDLSWHRLLNLRLLARAQGHTNVTIILGGDTPRLPFPEDHFDLVVLTGVIEWIPVGRAGDPRDHQMAFLREIARVTREGGEVFLASENRYAYSYWAGRPDDHTGLLFGSLLPRRLADVYSRLRRGVPYQHYTYSKAQYTRLLAGAGFSQTEFHGLTPAHRIFTKIFPLSIGRVLDAEESRGSPVKDLLLRNRAAVRLASAFGIRASRRPLDGSYVQRLCRFIDQSGIHQRPLAPEPYRLITTNFSIKAAVRTAAGDGGLLLRIPLTPTKRRLHANALAAQESWRGHSVVGPYLAPTLREIEFEGTAVTCESLASAPSHRGARSSAPYGDIGEVLTSLARCEGPQNVAAAWSREVQEFSAYLEDAHRELLLRLQETPALSGLPTCYHHGDFHWENLLLRDGRLLRIIDWEWAAAEGYPLADAFHFVVNFAGVGFSGDAVQAVERVLAGDYPHAAVQALFDGLLRLHGLERDALGSLALLYLYHTLRKHWDASASYGLPRRFLSARHRTVLDQLPALGRHIV
jgi:SAM-dependent methyltransferase